MIISKKNFKFNIEVKCIIKIYEKCRFFVYVKSNWFLLDFYLFYFVWIMICWMGNFGRSICILLIFYVVFIWVGIFDVIWY